MKRRDRGQPLHPQASLARIFTTPFGKQIREYIAEPLLYLAHPVFWRNHEASYDAAELEPSSRKTSTYVLQEYFVPADRFDDFYPRMSEILKRHQVNGERQI
jgi:hypothetical protein